MIYYEHAACLTLKGNPEHLRALRDAIDVALRVGAEEATVMFADRPLNGAPLRRPINDEAHSHERLVGNVRVVAEQPGMGASS